MKYLLILILMMTACANKKVHLVPYNDVTVEKEFVPYLKEFELHCNKKVNVNIVFDDNIWWDWPRRAVGYCLFPGLGAKIGIEWQWWQNHTDPTKREQLIFHELGHCILNRWHEDSTILFSDNWERQKSIMHSRKWANYWYDKDLRAYYIKELCEGK